MSNSRNKKIIVYIISSLFIPSVFSLLYTKYTDESKSYYDVLIKSLIVFAILVVIIGIIELFTLILRIKKEKSCENILHSIDDIANSIKLPDGKPMFDVSEQTYSLYESIKQKENRIKKICHNMNHTIYHSTTAKKHLNWIEYVFWSFLKRIHDELGCKIIISLHYDERARENGLIDYKEQARYKELYDSYSNIAKELIGNDILVIDEKDFRGTRKHAKYYAKDFHDKFVKCFLQYVNQIISGSIDYKGFMRKVSYIESVFPIMAYSRTKLKFSRLYVLDRELAQEVWQQSPFIEYKSTHGIFFITAQTIRNANNEPLRIFSPNDTINITDSTVIISEKLKSIDIPTKRTMLQLLTATCNKVQDNCIEAIPDDHLDDSIKDTIVEINRIYNFSKGRKTDANQEQ